MARSILAWLDLQLSMIRVPARSIMVVELPFLKSLDEAHPSRQSLEAKALAGND